MSKGLFIKKSVKSLLNEASDKRKTLKRTLSALNLTAIGIGAIIGAGLFVLTGQAAAEYAGPGITISFILAGIVAMFSALCYAEFASLIPISGSAYSYAYVTLGEFAAWMMGCVLTLEYMLSACTVAVGWSGYFSSLMKDFGLNLPIHFSTAPIHYDLEMGWSLTGSVLNLPAMFIVGIMGYLIARGTKAAASFNNIMVIIKLAVVVLFIACGIAYINFDNLTPFIPENTGNFGQYGYSGIIRGAGVVFFAFIGFDALSTLAQEAKNPQKDLPKGMIGSLSICTVIYIIVAVVLTGIVSYKLLDVADPIAVAVNALGPNFIWLRFFIKIAILAGLTSVVMVMLLGQSRIFYTIAKDGLLPKKLCSLNEKTQTPLFTTVVVTLVAMIIAGLFPVGILGQLVSMGTLLVFAMVCFGVLILRYRQPSLHRPFKVPFAPWVPLAGTVASVAQMLFLPAVTWIQLIAWIAIGCYVYFKYSIHHSLVRKGKS
ncbi:MAG: amino acid permease [Chlamydiae bacterium]|nr:amino acid permease [Chlamydiota bacterium]